MPSLIDDTVPVYGNPSTLSVRQNFGVAKSEISDLQSRTVGGPFLPIAGGTLAGALILPAGSPTNARQAVTRDYVDVEVATQSLWRGIFHVAANSPDLSTSAPLNGYAWTAVTADPTVAEPLAFDLPPLTAGTPIENGDSLRFSTAQGWVQIKASSLTIDIAETLFLPLIGGVLTGPLTLSGPPTAALHAASKTYVDGAVTGVTPVSIGAVPLAGGAMTGLLVLSGPPTAPLGAATKQYTDNAISTAIAPLAPLASPALTGNPTAPTQAIADNSTRLATTGFVHTYAAPLAAPAFTGIPTAPTAAIGTATSQIATTGFVANGFLPLTGGSLSGALNINALLSLGGVGFATHASSYTYVYGGGGTGSNAALALGGPGDQANYYQNTNHVFRNLAASATYLTVGANGIAVTGAATVSGALTVTGNTSVGNLDVRSSLGIVYSGAGGGGTDGIAFIYFNPNVYVYVDNVQWGYMLLSSSDRRAKANIEPATADALAAIRAIKLYEYDRVEPRIRPSDSWPHERVGFIAQDLAEIIPEAATIPDRDDLLAGVQLLPMVAYLVRAVQQLADQLDDIRGFLVLDKEEV